MKTIREALGFVLLLGALWFLLAVLALELEVM